MLKYFGKKVLWLIVSMLAVIFGLMLLQYFSPPDAAIITRAKPVIYLYPEQETEIARVL